METSIQNAQSVLDEMKLRLSIEALSRFPLDDIRRKSIANLQRWKNNGVWCDAYEEWLAIMSNGDDCDVVLVMTGRDDRGNRLRQSLPYVGLLPKEEVLRLGAQSPISSDCAGTGSSPPRMRSR